jgi:hypothetical protein
MRIGNDKEAWGKKQPEYLSSIDLNDQKVRKMLAAMIGQHTIFILNLLLGEMLKGNDH